MDIWISRRDIDPGPNPDIKVLCLVDNSLILLVDWVCVDNGVKREPIGSAETQFNRNLAPLGPFFLSACPNVRLLQLGYSKSLTSSNVKSKLSLKVFY